MQKNTFNTWANWFWFGWNVDSSFYYYYYIMFRTCSARVHTVIIFAIFLFHNHHSFIQFPFFIFILFFYNPLLYMSAKKRVHNGWCCIFSVLHLNDKNGGEKNAIINFANIEIRGLYMKHGIRMKRNDLYEIRDRFFMK